MSSLSLVMDKVEEVKKELLRLQEERYSLETEADAITSELNAAGPNGLPPIGVKGRLVDNEGFPLAGYDLMSIRTKRNRLSCIQTDHKAVMKAIETKLHLLHEAQASSSTTSSTQNIAPAEVRNIISSPNTADLHPPVAAVTAPASAVPMVPIAKVNEVSDGSPASESGLMVGDLIIRLGKVDMSHPMGLGGLAQEVSSNVGKELPLLVLRESSQVHGQRDTKNLVLVPHSWRGRGLLGVHLLPP
ncbi:unnamed protein product [Discosporangium mesarthrocarpum]